MAPASSSRRASGQGARGGELGARQQGGDGPAGGEGVHVGVGEVGAVVGAGRVELDGELDAGAVAELVGVHAWDEPPGASGGEDGAGGVAVEGAAFAEDVDPAGVGRAGVEHGAGDQVHVARRVAGVLGGDDVRAEIGDLVGVGGGDAQGAGLVLDGEAVAGLGLEGGGALAQRLGEVAGDVGGERLVAGGPGGGDGGADASGAVRAAGHAGGELLGAVAREDEVRVGVDEAGDRGPSAGVDDVVGGGDARALPRPHDPVALDDEGGVPDHSQRRTVALRRVVGHQRGDPHHRRRRVPSAATVPVRTALHHNHLLRQGTC
ncbi:hypothetical protein M2168_002097 [Streptomyces sp. CZ24]|nr:hypothetical protein [Streptomyces sp. CZ24]